MKFLLYFLLTVFVVSRKNREFEYYGRITCENGESCLGRDCKVEFHVLKGGDWTEREDACSIRTTYNDSRYHIRCYADYDMSYDFYLKFAGQCHDDRSWSEKRIRIRKITTPVVYTGDVDIEKTKRFIDDL
ncbi:unnamed protein product [Bursaphelenchus xylophilus]|uniref:(pine wood nematode) hypothetical protein n=1 Tax=Bursaphelenchus xylophilus TaxID=6326 RepID=A0A1I7SEH1_BURXY|nr:unnamed protein product [Bursaphelenchus xylophilus]CAG9103921.1 unnamed protein product [Bursaphelenchus xylophilus]